MLFYAIEIYFLLQKNEDNWDNKNHDDVQKLLLLIIKSVSPFKIIEIITYFSGFQVCFETEPRYIFFLFSIQNIKGNCYIFLLKYFPIIFFWWIVYFIVAIFIYKRFNFCYSLWFFSYFFIIYHNCYRVLKMGFIVGIFDGIYCFLFVFYLIRRIYIWSTTI